MLQTLGQDRVDPVSRDRNKRSICGILRDGLQGVPVPLNLFCHGPYRRQVGIDRRQDLGDW